MDNNIIKFRVPPEALEVIEAFRLEGESKHEAFRRIALTALDIEATGRTKAKKSQKTQDTAANKTQDTAQNTSQLIDTDTLRDELLAGIRAKLENGYLSALLEGAVEACSLPVAMDKFEKELEFIEGKMETTKLALAKLKQESGKRLVGIENVIENFDITANSLAGSVMAQEKLIAALNESTNELRQDLYALGNQLAQIQANQRQIEAANVELAQRNRELLAKLGAVDITTCTCDTEIYQPVKVVTAFDPADLNCLELDPEEDRDEIERLWAAINYREQNRQAEENLEWWVPLGVNQNAAPDEVKLAYYAIAKANHPDVTGDDGERIREVTRAWNHYRKNVMNQQADNNADNAELSTQPQTKTPSVGGEVKPVNPKRKAKTAPTPKPIKTDGLNQGELAARLGVSAGTVSQKTKLGEFQFKQWSAANDPEEIGWRRSKRDSLYYRA